MSLGSSVVATVASVTTDARPSERSLVQVRNAPVPEPNPSEDAKGGSGTDRWNATMRPDRVGWWVD